jgi:hypothetical protein
VKLAYKQRGIILHITTLFFDSAVKLLRKMQETQGTAKVLFQYLIQVLSVDETQQNRKAQQSIVT